MDKIEGLFAVIFRSREKGDFIEGPWPYEEAVEFLSHYTALFYHDQYESIRLIKITFLD